jgi:Putative lumazine-binding
MNRVTLVLLGTVTILLAGISIGARTQSATEETAVRATVETYLHGLKFNDVNSFKKVFYPGAKLFFVRKNGELGELTQENWYKGFVASTAKEEKGELRIESVDITGNAASVKVVEVYPDSTYTDYVSLLKLPQGWKIVNKIFTFEKHAK